MSKIKQARHRAEQRLAGAVDRFFTSAVLSAPRSDLDDPQAKLAELREFVERWNQPALFADAEAFFGRPERPVASLRAVRAGGLGRRTKAVQDIAFRSPHVPHFGEVGARFASFESNQWVHARRFLSGRVPAPTAIVLVHGYLGGALAAEAFVWPLNEFLKRGVDVILPVLPFHGRRNDRGLAAPPRWPGRDLTWALEGFRQVVADMRALVAWLRADGHQHVGMMGMSLGGFSTALLATVEPELAFAVPYIPLASFADWTRDAGQLKGSARERAELYTHLEEAHGLISPLRRPLQIPKSRAFVAVGERDAVTPLSHGRRIAEHFDVPLEMFHGGHIVQAGRSVAFEKLFAMLEREGLL